MPKCLLKMKFRKPNSGLKMKFRFSESGLPHQLFRVYEMIELNILVSYLGIRWQCTGVKRQLEELEELSQQGSLGSALNWL